MTIPPDNQGSDDEPTVFIVEDKEGPRNSLLFLLETLKIPARGYESAEAFLADFDIGSPGCLVLDVRMPKMSGLSLHEHLIELGAQIPVIYLTAFADVPMAIRCMKNGAVEFLEKPISDQILIDHIQKALAIDKEARALRLEHQRVLNLLSKLTDRESQVLDYVVEGLSSKGIGGVLKVSFKTVEAHRARIMKKMMARSVPELIRNIMSLPPHLRRPRPPQVPDDVE